MSDMFEIAKSIQAVSVQGMKMGQEIADMKYAALVEAAKRVRAVLNDEGKEILTKAEMEQLLFDAIAKAESK